MASSRNFLDPPWVWLLPPVVRVTLKRTPIPQHIASFLSSPRLAAVGVRPNLDRHHHAVLVERQDGLAVPHAKSAGGNEGLQHLRFGRDQAKPDESVVFLRCGRTGHTALQSPSSLGGASKVRPFRFVFGAGTVKSGEAAGLCRIPDPPPSGGDSTAPAPQPKRALPMRP